MQREGGHVRATGVASVMPPRVGNPSLTFESEPPRRFSQGLLSPGWPLSAYLLGYPIWWALGISNFMLPVVAVPMAFDLLRRRAITVPRGFGLWLLFLGWVLIGVAVLWADAPGAVPGGGPGRLLAFGLRLSFYVGATVVLLYIGNLPERELPTLRLVRLLGWMFVIAAAGGVLGLLAPNFEFRSLAEMLLPSSIASSVGDTIHPAAAQVQDVLGPREPRPKAPFAYTNEWGANLSLLVPFFIVAWFGKDAGWRRFLAPLVLLAGLTTLIYSLNRGAWLGLVVAAVYLAVRFAASGRLAVLTGLASAAILTVAILIFSPLGGLVDARLDSPHSNLRRGLLIEQTVTSATASPVVGFGSTRPVQGNLVSIAVGISEACPKCAAPPLGTHGHLWLLVFGQGFIGAAFFLGFFARRFVQHWRDRSGYVIAAVTTLVMFGLYLLYYNLLPFPLFIAMCAVGIAWRLQRNGSASETHEDQRREGSKVAS